MRGVERRLKSIAEGFDDVLSISKYRYRDFDELQVMEMGAMVGRLEAQLFRYTERLEAIHVHPSNCTYTSEDGVLFNKSKTRLICYPQAKQGAFYRIPDSVECVDAFAFSRAKLLKVDLNRVQSLGDCAFEGCGRLRSIEFPETLTSIGYVCFQGCNAIRKIYIPPNLRQIDFPALPMHIENAEVAAGNECYTAEEGVLFSKDKKVLYQYPSRVERERYEIGDFVETISGSAFEFCRVLSVFVPRSVTRIERFAFAFMKAPQSVELPRALFEQWRDNIESLSEARFILYD